MENKICSYNGTTYSLGSTIWSNNSELVCNNVNWEPTGKDCSTELQINKSMKTQTLIRLTFLLCLITININIKAQDTIKAQKVKALKIVYDITYPTTKPLFKASCYTSAVVLIHGSNFLSKSITEDDEVTSSLSNDCCETVFTSMTNLPIILKTTKEDAVKQSEKYNMLPPKTTVTSSTKQILGLACKKIMTQRTFNGKTYTSYDYVYQDYKNPNYCLQSIIVPGIEGVMLGCENDMTQGSIQVWTAKSVSEEFVDSSYFVLPTNYSVMTMDEYIQKLTANKAFRKQCSEVSKMSKDGKKAIRKEIWHSLPKDLLEVAVQGTQQFEASQQLNKNPNGETINNYINVIKNNNTLSSTDAINANNNILSNSMNSASKNSQVTPESSASTNGGSFNHNAGAAKKCADDTQNQWKNTMEYNNYLRNPDCNKMAYISQRKLAELILQNCSQYLPPAEVDGFRKTISSLTSTINSMEDCKTYNFK
jgi:hypothetical protein